MRLRGKVAVVTGGGSGIGRGIVLAMAREGADLAIPDIQVVNAEKVAQEVQALGRKAFALKTDVTSATDVKAMIDRTRETLGRIDIVVNNAGIAAPPGMPFTNSTEEDWDRVYAVNVKSVFLVCKAVAPHFIERKGGSITPRISAGRPCSSPPRRRATSPGRRSTSTAASSCTDRAAWTSTSPTARRRSASRSGPGSTPTCPTRSAAGASPPRAPTAPRW